MSTAQNPDRSKWGPKEFADESQMAADFHREKARQARAAGWAYSCVIDERKAKEYQRSADAWRALINEEKGE